MTNNLTSFTSLPSISELLCVNAIIEKSENVKISTFNSIILKCRQLIFENQEVIAYPELENSYFVVVVAKETYFANGHLKNCLKKYNLKVSGPPVAVTRYTYERCCYYTILAKISPKWNTIANYFVKGREFLINNSPTDCTYLTIRINEQGETTFIFNTGGVKLPTMTLHSLDLNYKHLQTLSTKKFTIIDKNECKTVRVLPSLKKGKIISISKNLEQSKTFSEYKYMKRYWKNTYGYRLPEVEKDIIYFDVKFFDESPIFTYPIMCVRPYNPVFLKRTTSAEVCNEFITDLLSAVPILLGENYKPPILTQTDIGLSSATQLLNRQNAVVYTPENHFYPNRNLSDTQNSAVVFLKTQNTTQSITQNVTQNNGRSLITQFVQELQRQESLYSDENTRDENDKLKNTPISHTITNSVEKSGNSSNSNHSISNKKLEVVKEVNFVSNNNIVNTDTYTKPSKINNLPKRNSNISTNSRYKCLDIRIESKIYNEECEEKKRKSN